MTETDLTEIDLATTIQPTPLAALLETSSKPHPLGLYRGVLSPVELDAPEREIEALAKEAAVHDLGWLRRVAVHGEDRFRWLSGMITNTVNDLGAHGGAWNLVLNAQGRVQGDLTVWRENDELELDIAADQYEKLKTHLERFIIMDDVELLDLNDEVLSGETALGLTGPLADQVLGRLSLPTLSEPMTGTRVEWIGFDLRIMRGYGALAPHYEIWVPRAGLAKLWLGLRTAAATRWELQPLRCFGLLKAFRHMAWTLSSAIWRMRPRRCEPCTSTKAATWGRKLWSASARAATFTSICGSSKYLGRSHRRELNCASTTALQTVRRRLVTSPVRPSSHCRRASARLRWE